LTAFDKYALACLFVLLAFGIWHSIVGTLIFNLNNFGKITPTSYWFSLDRDVLIAFGSIFIIAHVLLIAWYCLIPLRERHEMRRKESEYRKLLAQKQCVKEQSSK
jgi:hypothetical protein